MLQLKTLSNQNLLKGLNDAVRKERESQVILLEYLAEVERRKLFAVMGYSSLWRFAVEELHLSEDSAIKRIQAARLGARYTCILPLLREGKLSLSVIYRLYPYVRDYNFRWLVDECQDKSVREVKAILAKQFPKAVSPDEVKEINSEQLRISFVADTAFREKMEDLKARLGHRFPEGKLCDLFLASMAALEKELNQKVQTNRVRKTDVKKKRQTRNSRYLSKSTRDHVWKRDKASCSYVSPQGKRCGEKKFLEFDHKVAWSHGGSNDSDNIRLLCRTHNRLMADRVFGANFMNTKIKSRTDENYRKRFQLCPPRHESINSAKTNRLRIRSIHSVGDIEAFLPILRLSPLHWCVS